MKKYLIFAALLTGCATNKSDPNRSILENMNGENTHSTAGIATVPILITHQAVTRKISGRVVCGEGLGLHSVNHATLTLIEGKRTLATASSDITGSYLLTFQGALDGKYTLEASAKCGKAKRELSMREETKLMDFDFALKN